jgi:hypothetical protein
MAAFRNCFGKSSQSHRAPRGRRTPQPARRRQPFLEILEDRMLLSVNFHPGLTSENAWGTLGVASNFQPVEPQVTVNPRDPTNVVLSQQYGLDIFNDGGQSFPQQVQFPLAASSTQGGDTSTVFDPQGRLFWANLANPPVHSPLGFFIPGVLSVYVMQLDPTTGATLRSPVLVSTPPAGSLDDKEFLTTDQSGNLFIAWTRFSNNNQDTAILLSRSADHGATWSAPITVSGALEGFVWPATVSVGPNGDVYVAYHSTLTNMFGNLVPTTGQVYVARYSNDLSTVYSKTSPFGQGGAQIRNSYAGTGFDTQGTGQATVLADPARPGYVYLVAVNDPSNGGAGDPADVVLTRSTNFGATWTTSTLEAGPNNSFQLFPTAAIDQFGHLVVAWYDNRNAGTRGQDTINFADGSTSSYYLLDVYAKESWDGGLTWSDAFQVNAQGTPLHTVQVDTSTSPPTWSPIPRIDDYFGVAVAGGRIYVAREGNFFATITQNGNQITVPTGEQVYLDTIARGTLTVTGDENGNPTDDHIIVASVNNNTDVQVTVNGLVEYTGLWSTVGGGITINPGQGNDTIEVQGLQLHTPVQINEGDGNNSVIVGAGDLNGVNGNVVIAGGAGSNSLMVNDGASLNSSTVSNGVTYTLTDQTVMRVNHGLFFGNNQAFPFTQGSSITYHNLASVQVIGGHTGVTYDVLSTAPATPVTIDGGSIIHSALADTVNVESTSPTLNGITPALTVNLGNADDTVNISPTAQALAKTLGGDVAVAGGAGNDTLNLDDQADTDNTNFTVTDSLAWRTFTALVHFSAIAHVVVNGGSGDNSYHVQNTEANATTEVHTGDGVDHVSVEATQGPLTVDLGNNPLDTVELSAIAQSLDNLAGGVSVKGTLANGSGQGTLILDDQNTPVLSTTFPAKTVTFTVDGAGTTGSGSVTRTERVLVPLLGWVSSVLTFGFSSLANLVVNGGNVPGGGNTFNVESTPSGLTTDLYGGTGGAAFTLGATGQRLLDLAGTVKVHGQGGTTSLALNDQNRPFVAVYTLTSTSFDDGISGRQLTYDGIQTLTVNVVTPWSNTLAIQNTLASTAVIVNEGTGSDAVNVGDASNTVGGIQGAITVNGKGANTTLNVHDDGNPVSENYTVAPTSIQRSIIVAGVYNFNIAPINYYSIGHVAVYVGTAQTGLNQGAVYNTLDVVGTAAGTVTDLYGNNSGGQTAFAAYPYVFTYAGPILGAIHFHGSSIGLDTLSYVDYFDPTAQTYTMTAGQMVASGFAPVTYDGRFYGVGLETAVVGGSKVNVLSTAPAAAIGIGTVVDANAGDVVTVGSQAPNLGGSLAGLAASGILSIHTLYPSSAASVILDDSADTQTGKQVTFQTDVSSVWEVDGLAPQVIELTLSTGSKVQVVGGSPAAGQTGSNTYNVQTTPAGTTLTLDAGSGGDTVKVGDANNTLGGIQGALDVIGKGNTTLSFNDLGGTPGTAPNQAYNYSLAQNSFSRTGTATVTFSGLTTVNLQAANAAGSGYNVLGVASTAPGTTYNVYAGTGLNEFLVFDINYTLNGIQGPLFLHGTGGSLPNDDLVEIDDVDKTTRHTFLMNAGATSQSGVVQRFNTASGQADMVPINYDGLNAYSVLYTAGSAGATINVQSNAPDLFTIIAAGTGDTVNIGNRAHTMAGIQGELRIQGGKPTVNLDDSGDATARTIDMSSDTPFTYLLTGLLPQSSFGLGNLWLELDPSAPVTVKTGAGTTATNDLFRIHDFTMTPALTIDAGNGSNTLVGPNLPTTWTITGANSGTIGPIRFSHIQNLVGGSASDVFMFAPGGSLSGSLNGGGGGDWLDYSGLPATTSVTVNLVTGAATGVVGGVSNIANVRGGPGNDTLRGNGGNILIGGSGRNFLVDAFTGSAASGRSLLIGGSGSSTLTAGAAGDILIAGTTSYNAASTANDLALQSILAEWQSADSYLLRFQRIEGQASGGLNGTNTLIWGQTVQDSDKASVLNGGAGLDWFFANFPGGDDIIHNLNKPGKEHLDNTP